MSTLSTNLEKIYTTKLQLKQAIGTSSDIFEDYPSYVANMVTPTGYTYVTSNGDYNVSTYQMVNVNVAGQTPTGTINIKTNQNYDVSAYAYANVQVDINKKTAPVLLVTSSFSYLDQEENEHIVSETKVYQHYGSDIVSHTDSSSNTWDAWEINLPCSYNSDNGRLEFAYSYQLSLYSGRGDDDHPNKYIALNYTADGSNNPVLEVSGTVCDDLTLYDLAFNYYDESENEIQYEGAIGLGTDTLIAEGNWAANVTNCKLYIGVNWNDTTEEFDSVFELVPETTS